MSKVEQPAGGAAEGLAQLGAATPGVHKRKAGGASDVSESQPKRARPAAGSPGAGAAGAPPGAAAAGTPAAPAANLQTVLQLQTTNQVRCAVCRLSWQS